MSRKEEKKEIELALVEVAGSLWRLIWFLVNFILKGSADRDQELEQLYLNNNISDGILKNYNKSQTFDGSRLMEAQNQKIFKLIKAKAEKISELVSSAFLGLTCGVWREGINDLVVFLRWELGFLIIF